VSTTRQVAILLLHIIPEHHGRMHRFVLYEPGMEWMEHIMLFVGFVSKKQANLSQEIIDDLQAVDKQLVAELAYSPGLLSYSSRERSQDLSLEN
jgi:hypothetical protein